MLCVFKVIGQIKLSDKKRMIELHLASAVGSRIVVCLRVNSGWEAVNPLNLVNEIIFVKSAMKILN